MIRDSRIGLRSLKNGKLIMPSYYATGEQYDNKSNPAPSMYWLNTNFFVILRVGFPNLRPEIINEFQAIIKTYPEDFDSMESAPAPRVNGNKFANLGNTSTPAPATAKKNNNPYDIRNMPGYVPLSQRQQDKPAQTNRPSVQNNSQSVSKSDDIENVPEPVVNSEPAPVKRVIQVQPGKKPSVQVNPLNPQNKPVKASLEQIRAALKLNEKND